jgi:hypothetical protein
MRKNFQDARSITIKRAHINDYKDWDKFLENTDHSTIFHTARWGTALEESSKKYVFLLILAKDESNQIIGGFPLIQVRHAPFISSLVSILHGHGGVICSDQIIYKNLCNFNFGISPAIIKVSLSNYHDIDFAGYNSAGFNYYKNGSSYFINLLRPMDEIWKYYDGGTRNKVRKAIKNGVVIKEAENDDDIIIIEDLYRETMQRASGDLSLLPVIKTIYKKRDSKHVQFFFAEHNGENIAFAGILFFNKSAYDWVGGSSTKNLGYAPNNLLIHYSIEWLKAKEFSYFCLGGGSIKASENRVGLDKFKSGWGGEDIPSYEFNKILNPIGHAIEPMKRILRR